MSHHDPRAVDRARAQFYRRQGVRPPGRVFPPGTETVPTLPREELPVGPAAPPPPNPPPAWVPPAVERVDPQRELERLRAATGVETLPNGSFRVPVPVERPAPTPAPQRLALPESHIEWLPLGSLRPWRLQRPVLLSRVRKIAREFDPDTWGTLIVSRRGDADTLLDGNHRLQMALRIKGWADRLVKCEVYENLTDEQEDKLFAAQAAGMRRPIAALHNFKVRLDHHELAATEIAAAVEGAGLTINFAGGRQENAVVAIKALDDLYDDAGIDRVRAALTLCAEALGPSGAAYAADTLRGVVAFLVRYEGRYDHDGLVRRLRKVGVDTLLSRAAEGRRAYKGPLAAAIGKVILAEYNVKRSTGRLGDWQEHYRAPDQIERRQARNRASRPTRPEGGGA